jgi:phosphoglycerate dehydrogenase-like enzyme
MADFRIAVLDDYQHVALTLADWSPVRARSEVVVFDRHLSEDEAAEQLHDFDALCLMRERMAMPRRLIERLPRLKLICITGGKHRTLDEDAVRERGIELLAASGSETGASATSELAWGLILAWMRRIPQEAQAMRAGGWQTQCGSVLRGKTLGLVGLGKLGRQMVPVAHAFGMQVRAWSQNLTPEAAAAAGAQYTSKEDLFIISDIVSLHLVLGERSRGIVTRADLGRMRPHALLVNTARAGLVDQDALYEALAQGRIGGAALDVFDEEPLPPDDRFRTLDNVVLTPHLGYAAREQMRAYQQNTVRHLVDYLAGAR